MSCLPCKPPPSSETKETQPPAVTQGEGKEKWDAEDETLPPIPGVGRWIWLFLTCMLMASLQCSRQMVNYAFSIPKSKGPYVSIRDALLPEEVFGILVGIATGAVFSACLIVGGRISSGTLVRQVKVMIVGCLLACAGNTWTSLASSTFECCAGQILMVIGNGLAYSPCYTFVHDLFIEQPQAATGILIAFHMGLGSCASSFAGTLCLIMGWRHMYQAMAAVFVLLAVLLFGGVFTLPAKTPRGKHVAHSVKEADEDEITCDSQLALYARVFSRLSAWVLTVACVTTSTYEALICTWLATYMGSGWPKKLNEWLALNGVVILLVATSLGSVIGGRLYDWVDWNCSASYKIKMRMAGTAAVLAASSSAVSLLHVDFWTCVMFTIVARLIYCTGVLAMLFVAFARISPTVKDRGHTSGLFFAIYWLGGSIGQTVINVLPLNVHEKLWVIVPAELLTCMSFYALSSDCLGLSQTEDDDKVAEMQDERKHLLTNDTTTSTVDDK